MERSWDFGRTKTKRGSCRTAGRITQSLSEWRPSKEIANSFWPDASLRLERIATRRFRMFAPVNTGVFIQQAALVGRLLLTHRGLDESQRLRHDLMRLVFQRALRSREYFYRTITRPSDLRMHSRANAIETSLLPPEIGVSADGELDAWNMKRLIEEGKAACRELGFVNPSFAEIIRQGFRAAAEHNPLEVVADQTEGLVRLTLFSLPPVEDEDDDDDEPDIREFVFQELCASLDGQLDCGVALDKWIADKKADLVHRIAKRKNTPHGSLDRIKVRRALAEIGWAAHQSVGCCIEVCMRAVRAGLRRPLMGWEAAAYELMYYRQPLFGGLPLILLQSRFRFLKPAISLMIQAGGDRRSVAVVHRMMMLFGEFSELRRGDDRSYQQFRHHKNLSGRTAAHEAGTELLADNPFRTSASLTDFIKDYVLSAGLLEEEFFSSDWDVRVEDLNDQQVIAIFVRDGRLEKLNLSMEKLKKFADKRSNS